MIEKNDLNRRDCDKSPNPNCQELIPAELKKTTWIEGIATLLDRLFEEFKSFLIEKNDLNRRDCDLEIDNDKIKNHVIEKNDLNRRDCDHPVEYGKGFLDHYWKKRPE